MLKRNLILLIPFVISFLFAIYFRKLLSELPSIEFVKTYTPHLSSKLYDVDGNLIAEFYIEKRDWLPLSEIPEHLKKAIIAIEDHKFYHHWGMSYKGIIRAIRDNLLKVKVKAGGSTITQQLARSAFLYRRRTISRKIKEFLLALQLERNYSKDEILEMYLNQVYLGHGAYGVGQAAKLYFSKPVENLNLAESALLAGLIRNPHYYSPFKNPKRAFFRRKLVLERMRKLKFISHYDERVANLEPINVSVPSVPVKVGSYFVESVRIDLENRYGQEIYTAGYEIYTTLNSKMQKIAEEVYDDYLAKFDEKKYKATKSTIPVQGALIVMETKTGKILTMIGGRDFKVSQFNRATQAYRQPGSAFKLFVALAALINGYTPAHILYDTPLVYMNDGRNWKLVSRSTDYLLTLDEKTLKDPMKVWVPQNYRDKYYGYVSFRKFLEQSLNSCSVQLTENIGVANVINIARKLKITSPLINTYSLGLGASEVTLLELVAAYNTVANQGVYVHPFLVTKITDRHGEIVEVFEPKEIEVLSPQLAFIMTNILKGVIERGTGKYAKRLKITLAGKTGTTNDCTDAWFIGYTPDIICGVWIGYDEKVTLGKNMTGGALACPLFTEFMEKLIKEKMIERKEFTQPPGITFAYINPQDGLLTNDTTKGFYEAFIEGTQPTKYSSLSLPSKELIEESIEDENNLDNVQ